MARRENSEINAGSMADIAFLLLIFFLVTTTMDVDSGISRKLPEKQPEDVERPPVKQKNIFEINLNRNNEILVEEDEMDMKDLRQAVIDFLDNGGGVGNVGPDGEPGKPCYYCEGKKLDNSSDHPNKSIVSVQTDRGTSYGVYIYVQNEILSAYSFLRDRYARKYLKGVYGGMGYKDLLKLKENDEDNEALEAAIQEVKDAYPQIISDAEPTK